MNTPFNTRTALAAHPAFAGLSIDTDGTPCVWKNTYECHGGHDVELWSDEWSCCCDTECPKCGRDCSPISEWIGPEDQEALQLWDDLPDVLAATPDVTEKIIEGEDMGTHCMPHAQIIAATVTSVTWHDAVESVMADTNGSDDNSRMAARVLRTIYPAYDDDTAKTAVMDCLSDLRHLCDLMGWDFADLNTHAHQNYSAEVVAHGTAENKLLKDAVIRDLS